MTVQVFFREDARIEAKLLVEEFHYSQKMPPCFYCASWHYKGGLFGNRGQIIAAATFASPVAYHESLFANSPMLELKRLVRHETLEVPPLSGLIAQACRRIKELHLAELLISYADIGEIHHGGIYQACSWFYHGERKASKDMYVSINGRKVGTRGLGSTFGTHNIERLQQHLPSSKIEPYMDQGKHLYWRPLTKAGVKLAKELKFKKLPYPKPAKAQKEEVEEARV